MKTMYFAKRNLTEMLRDPISYIFCVGFPIAMLLLFALINHYTGGHTPFFEMPSLAPGLMVFSLSFVMLSMSLLVSKDRATSFLSRLFTSPMRTADFVLGYALPGMLVAVLQLLITCGASLLLGLALNTPLSAAGLGLTLLSCLPAAAMFVFLGILFGSFLNDKAAPGMTSIVISACGILGGCWMPLDTMGTFATVCKFLPFYPAVLTGRAVLQAQSVNLVFVGIVPVYAVLFLLLGIVAFRKKMYIR